jgi:Tol biopolymer transport system component/predicted Ser/Thr protein kinase
MAAPISPRRESGMSENLWQRIEDVFHRAADLPASDRAAFLSTACAGDDELRREVESLLANDDPDNKVLQAAVVEAAKQLPNAQDANDDASNSDASDNLVGKRAGPYLIDSLIGKGGMGLVFKARDTQLNRTVALKVLPAGQFADLERKRRFFQEAQAASALNHPNIITVYGITQENGVDFLVMEYAPGQTLDQLIPRKGLPLKQALKYAIEIADALVAAHAARIVHRDVKPSNIIVAEQGRLKVLDFGLAKQSAPPQEGDHILSAAPVTKAGLVFGTAAYMSPEQAQGKPADARSDIFAFGALLYEMVTGRRAFQGENVITILAAVINQEPPLAHTIVPNAPRELEWLITRCLKKDPDRRIQQMLEVKLALQELLEGAESASSARASVQTRRRVWLVPVIIALVLGLAPGVWLGSVILRQQPITFQRLTFRNGDLYMARFAPGGSVVYAAKWNDTSPTVFSVQPGNREARDLGLPSGNILAVSRSGEMALLLGGAGEGAAGTLAQVPLGGGAPREILENVTGADWDPEGKSLAVVRTVDGRHRLEYPIGSVLYETQSLRPPLLARISPNGDLVAFFDPGEAGDYSVSVIGAKRPRQVLSRGWRAVGGMAWSPNGKEIWFSGGRTGIDPAIYAVDLSGRERMLTQVTGWGLIMDVASDGRALLSTVDSRIGIRCLAPAAKEERDLAWLDASVAYDLSSDGRLLLFSELSYGEGRNPAIYLRRTDGSPAVRLGYGNRPSLSPDGKRVVCTRRDGEKLQILLLPTGPGEPTLLQSDGIRPEIVEWFPDGKRILVTGGEPGQQPRTYVRDLAGGKTSAITSPGSRASHVSPDSKSVVVIKGGKLYVHSLDSGSETAIGAVGGSDIVMRWSSDGRYLFLQRKEAENRSAKIMRMDVHTGKSEIWRELKPPEQTAVVTGIARISGDGKSYAFSYQRDLATLYLVRGLK